MTHKAVYDMLKTLNIPVAYDHFDSNKAIQPPFIVYREISPETFKADSITYYRPYEFEIEVITEKKRCFFTKSNRNIINKQYDSI